MKTVDNVVEFRKNSKNEEFDGVLKSYREKIQKLSADDNYLVLDLSGSNIFNITLRNSVVNIVFDNLPEPDYSYSAVLVIKQDHVGNRKVVFPENVLWSFNEVPVLAKKSNYADVINLITFDGGQTYYASHSLANLGK
jgi:hypothetical protein